VVRDIEFRSIADRWFTLAGMSTAFAAAGSPDDGMGDVAALGLRVGAAPR
jgi:hypothetical protein